MLFRSQFGLQSNAEAGKNSRLDKILEAKKAYAQQTAKWSESDRKADYYLKSKVRDIWNQLHDKELIWADDADAKRIALTDEMNKLNQQIAAIAARYPN